MYGEKYYVKTLIAKPTYQQALMALHESIVWLDNIIISHMVVVKVLFSDTTIIKITSHNKVNVKLQMHIFISITTKKHNKKTNSEEIQNGKYVIK